MKKVFGILLITLGIALMLYLVIYVMLYGGIVQIINNINPLNGGNIAIGILRIIFCSAAIIPGYIIFVIGLKLFYD